MSAVACFCHSDGLANYHGRYPLPGNRRINELELRLWRVWRNAVRPRLLGVDHSIPNLDLLWQFKVAGLEEIQISGHLQLVSPGDSRIPVEEGAAYAQARYRQVLNRLKEWEQNHGPELATAGFGPAEFAELTALKQERYDYLLGDPSRVREVMEVFADPLLIIRGRKPHPS